jgi:STE24 endopeptidase
VTPDRPPRLARRAALLTAVVAAVAFAALAVWLVPWDWVPGGRLVPMPVHRLFTPGEIVRMEHYSSLRRALGWSGYFASLLLAVALGFSPLGARIVRRATRSVAWWLAVPLGAGLLLVLGRLVALPFALLLRREDLRVGLTRQALSGWSADQVKSFVVSWVVTSLLLLVVVGFSRRSPRWWFAWAGGAALLLTVAGSFLYPVLVEPLFNRFTPMQSGPFKQSVFRLADREGVHIDDVLVADASRRTTTVNAYVSGFGGTRRVVVYDNLLKDLSPAEARLVIAHELGHAKQDDVLVGTALGALGSVLGVAVLALLLDAGWLRRVSGVAGPSDPAVVALVLALSGLGALLASPVQNTVSRAIEARADRAAIETTHADRTFVRMQREIALSSLSDPTPPWLSQIWFGSHPTVLQRAGLPASLRRAGS